MAAGGMFGDVGALGSLLEQSMEAAVSRSGNEGTRTGPAGQPAPAAKSTTVVKSGAQAAPAGSRAPAAEDPDDVEAGDPSAIWAAGEVAEAGSLLVEEQADDGRSKPKYDIRYKQSVGSGDVYLGTGDKTPSTVDCELMVVRIELPGATLADVDLDVQRQAIRVQTPKFKLAMYLPHPVRNDDGKAQWVADKEVLNVTLPIVRKQPWEL